MSAVIALVRNRHPVDDLADVRAEIKRLQEREAELREVILSDGCTLDGREFEAVVTTVKSERLDTAAIRKEFGLAKLRPFLKPTETRTIRIKAIDDSHLAEVDDTE